MTEESADPAAEIEGLIAAARKAPHNFVLMKTKDGVALKGHKTKSAKALVPLAKAAGGMPAISCMGVMTVKGRRIDLAVEDDDVPNSLPQLAKRYFKSIGVKAKVQITLPSGEVVGDGDPDDEGDETETEGVGDGTQPSETAVAPEDWKAHLTARLRVLVPQVKALADAGAAGADRLVAAIKAAGAEISGGNADKAGQLLDAVERALGSASKAAQGDGDSVPPPVPTDLTGLLAELREFAGRIAAMTDIDRKRLLAGLAAAANAAIKSGDPTASARAMDALRAALADGPVARGPATLPIWRDARDSVNDQLGRLQDAMRNHGMPLFARIADKGLNGITETRLVRLQAGLMDLDAAADEARPQAAAKVRAAVGEMRAFLSSNPVLPLLEANPLKVPVTLRTTLGEALDRIEQAVAG